ncbi:sigma-E factor negative regulatory protein RseB [Dokdonella fugitiva]|uniref:Sigma-E factor negative regulatory protein RseB n=1 Tax=Dokdonella fugitiva TaxID=328517 RepID=A0A839F153_9GAMM|nr:MucB/RseB C-terminal domain-containing protein [Dokdonella fugitiva]MBA8886054.1 sigma-E factor negative regulatory protein RseB [Dokdonella fugitiva]
MVDQGQRVTTARSLPMAFLVALVLAAGVARAEAPVPPQALVRMYDAIRRLDYQGSFVYARGAQVDALRIFHAGGIAERERLVGLNGARSEVVRDGATVTCMQGAAPTMLFRSSGTHLLPLLPDVGAAATGRYYAVVAAGTDRVAGYQAHRVDVVPRDGYRYGYRLWLEDDSGFPLRSAVIDANHRSLEEYMFVTLDIGARPRDSDLAASAGTTVAAPADEPTLGAPRWRVGDPPPGFVLSRTHAPVGGAEHQLYTDGVANVSIYIEPAGGGARADQRLSRGMLGIYSHEAGNVRFTAIGDVPRITLERMVRSLQPVAPAR